MKLHYAMVRRQNLMAAIILAFMKGYKKLPFAKLPCTLGILMMSYH